VRLRVDVAHIEIKPRERRRSAVQRWVAEKLLDDSQLTLFPREPRLDVNWVNNARLSLLSGKHRAIESARQQH
jgi:hypothetical protein